MAERKSIWLNTAVTVVIINVASKCGNTPQYEAIQKFHEAHGKDIIVLGFPANDFGAQEPAQMVKSQNFVKRTMV